MIPLIPSWLYETLAIIGGACVLCCAVIVAWSVWERATWEEPHPELPEADNLVDLDGARLVRWLKAKEARDGR